jgi:hypothetical protein
LDLTRTISIHRGLIRSLKVSGIAVCMHLRERHKLIRRPLHWTEPVHCQNIDTWADRRTLRCLMDMGIPWEACGGRECLCLVALCSEE